MLHLRLLDNKVEHWLLFLASMEQLQGLKLDQEEAFFGTGSLPVVHYVATFQGPVVGVGVDSSDTSMRTGLGAVFLGQHL